MSTPFQNKIANELAEIEAVLQKFPEGATAPQVQRALGLSMEVFTIQRRLKLLVDRGVLRTEGTRRSMLYFLKQEIIEEPVWEVQERAELYGERPTLHLSQDAQEIASAVSRALNKRTPVTYRREFLDSYIPNHSYYLTEAERGRLDKLTETPVAGQHPAGTYARHILQRLLIDLSWNSSRLEGNTYSLLDTERLLSQGKAAPDKSAAEAQMILNHKEAIEFLLLDGEGIGFNRYSLQNLHGILANNLLPDPAAPGRLRSYAVGIRQSVYTPTAIPQLIEEMFELILSKVSAIQNPHEQALFLMVQLPYLQPFDDVNKRVSRLAANISLNQHNRVPISFVGVPEDLYIKGLLGVYELNRTELIKDIFLWACEQSAERFALVRQSVGDPDPFRLRYKQMLQNLVSDVVINGMSKNEASKLLRLKASEIPMVDQNRFVEMAELELLSLHEGNFARYRIRPSAFYSWKKAWEA